MTRVVTYLSWQDITDLWTATKAARAAGEPVNQVEHALLALLQSRGVDTAALLDDPGGLPMTAEDAPAGSLAILDHPLAAAWRSSDTDEWVRASNHEPIPRHLWHRLRLVHINPQPPEGTTP